MEKSKIIEYVLNEWAMRSPDGLASDIDTIENINALKATLTEYGIEALAVDEVLNDMIEARGRKRAGFTKTKDMDYLFLKYDDKDNPYLVAHNHPEGQKKYPNGERYTGKMQAEKITDYYEYNEKNIEKADDLTLQADEIYRGMREKGVSLANVKLFKSTLDAYKDQSTVSFFKRQFDKYSKLVDVIAIYEGRSIGALKPIINAIDDVAFYKLGPGEIPFVFLLKGAKSKGGSAEGGGLDVLFADFAGKEKGVELKKLGADDTLGISLSTLEKFAGSKFNQAILELSLLAKDKKAEEFLLKVLEDNGNIYAKIPIPEGIDIGKMKEAIIKFFDNPRTTEISKNFVNAVLLISAKLLKNKPATKPAMATIDVGIGNQHKKLKVTDDSVKDLVQQINLIKVGESPGKIDVNVTQTEESSDDDIESKVMNKDFFKEEWDMQYINDQLTELLQNHYDLILAIEKNPKTKDKIYQIEKADIPKKLIFQSISQGRIIFKLLK